MLWVSGNEGEPHQEDDMGTTEPVINSNGETIATLTWNGATAKVDRGTIARKGVDVIVRLQNADTGRVRTYRFGDVAAAFYGLGLSVERCDGIDGWGEMAAMPGSAGRD
jgi:hypothetical protein